MRSFFDKFFLKVPTLRFLAVSAVLSCMLFIFHDDMSGEIGFLAGRNFIFPAEAAAAQTTETAPSVTAGTRYVGFELPAGWENVCKDIADDPPGSNPAARNLAANRSVEGRVVALGVDAVYAFPGITPAQIFGDRKSSISKLNKNLCVTESQIIDTAAGQALKYALTYEKRDGKKKMEEGLVFEDVLSKGLFYVVHLSGDEGTRTYRETVLQHVGATLSMPPSASGCRAQGR